MEVVRPSDPRSFLELARGLLERHEARNNLILGVAATVAERPTRFPGSRWWVALDDGATVAAALRTPPHDLVIGDPDSDDGLRAVIGAILEDDRELPGIVGNAPYVGPAAEALAQGLGLRAERGLGQGVFELTEVLDVPRPSGSSRPAEAADRSLVRSWFESFLIEVVPDPQRHIDDIERSLETRFATPSGGLWLWEDEGPVSLSGFGSPTPTGVRIGPVYTPPERRGRGYATALVAEQSRWLLEGGRRFCCLFTDLANPTSNAIYERIGYRRVGESARYAFG